MTTLRFAGDISLWPGLLLAVVVAVMAWRFYRREGFELSKRMRIILPTLRSLAFLLGVLILTGPVLHHRKTIGEPGKVRIYVDGSSSMNLADRHLNVARKLRIAREQQWLADGRIDFSLADFSDQLSASLQRDLMMERDERNLLSTEIKAVINTLTPPMRDDLQTALKSLTQALDAWQSNDATPLQGRCDTLQSALTECVTASEALFATYIQERMASDSGSIQSALDLFDQSSRWQRLQRGLQVSTESLVDRLRPFHDVEIVTLAGHDARSRSLADVSSDEPPETPDFPDARLTDLTTGITSTQMTASSGTTAVGEAASVERAAVVLLTDGRHNSGPSPVQTARLMGAQGIPFYPVSFGSTRAPRDLVMKDAVYPDSVFATDTLTGQLTFHDTMSPHQQFSLKISQRNELLWEQTFQTTGSGSRQVPFQIDVQSLVKNASDWSTDDVTHHSLPVELAATIVPLNSEAETSNNSTSIRLAVVTQPSRVMILDGRSRWEVRYLRNAFDRDSQWDVNVIIAGPGNDESTLPRGAQPGQFPSTRMDLMKYDLLIVGEVASSLLEDYEYEWIREFVQLRGGGLILIDGNRGRLQQQSTTELLDLVPVEWSDTPVTASPTQLRLTNKGRALPELLLSTPEQNELLWTQLPPPRSLSSVLPLPGSEVLVETVSADNIPRPLLVTRLSGAGRVLYAGSDESWRWRYKNADTYHQRFWNQVARYVMPQPFASSDEFVSVDSGKVAYGFGETANIRVQLRNADGTPAESPAVDALLSQDGKIVSTVSLTADTNVPGLYRGTTNKLVNAGSHEVSVRAAGFSSDALKARSSFVVRESESSELSQTSCNERLLQEIAVESGGSYLREEQLNQLPALLQPLSNGRIVESDTVLWQSYWWFAAILLLLTTEWWLRKRVGLL